ncbi:hypothetical protein ACOMHN_052887 [Nucella lapillus]
MFLRGGGDIQLLRCGDVEANPGPDPEPSTSRPSASLRQTRISTPRKSSQSAKDPSLSEVMATLNSINSSLNSKMNGMNSSLNGKMDGVKEDVGQLHQEFGTLRELPPVCAYDPLAVTARQARGVLAQELEWPVAMLVSDEISQMSFLVP